MFSMFINDLENMFVEKGANGINGNMFKLVLILYSDYTVLFANSIQDLQKKI